MECTLSLVPTCNIMMVIIIKCTLMLCVIWLRGNAKKHNPYCTYDWHNCNKRINHFVMILIIIYKRIHLWYVLQCKTLVTFCRDLCAHTSPVLGWVFFHLPIFPRHSTMFVLIQLCFCFFAFSFSWSSDEANRLSALLLFVIKFRTSPTVSMATFEMHFITPICTL